MKDRDMGFVRGLRVEQAQLENAIELIEHQTNRFPRDHKRERRLKVLKAHLNRIDRTIKEMARPHIEELMRK